MKSLFLLMSLVLISPVPGFAEQVALGAGAGAPLHQAGGTYESIYSPPFAATVHTGTAGQSLTLERSKRASFWGAIEWFPHPHAGLTVRGTFRRSPFEGANGPYHVAVDYLARQPPDNVERHYQYSRDAKWPDTTGHLDTFAIDALATVASGPGTRAHVRAGAGVSLISVSGSLQSLGLTTLLVGGHSVLFSNEYEAVLNVSRTWGVAGVAAGQVAIPLGAHAAIDLGVRLVLPRTLAAPTSVASVVPINAVQTLTVDEAQRALAPAPMRVRLTAADLLIGMRFVL